jgi:ABC-type transport system involved in multi-copper enzyme maturation permease subunit
MTKLLAISGVTLREALRQKLAVNLLVFALGLVAASFTISTLTFGEQYRIIVDIGLSAMEIFGTLIAVFLGAGLIARDVERRTVYPIIAKPVSRAEYVLGRYLGLVATTTLNMLVMVAVFTLVLAYYLKGLGFLHDSPFIAVVAAMVVRFAIVGAIACFFSCFTTATLSAIFTLSLVVAGLLSSDLVRYWAGRGAVMRAVGRAAFVLVPNLEALNLKEAMVYKDPVPLSFAVTGLGYGVLYAAAVVAFATAVFSRRDLR